MEKLFIMVLEWFLYELATIHVDSRNSSFVLFVMVQGKALCKRNNYTGKKENLENHKNKYFLWK